MVPIEEAEITFQIPFVEVLLIFDILEKEIEYKNSNNLMIDSVIILSNS
mgnify:CR=1 FL=1